MKQKNELLTNLLARRITLLASQMFTALSKYRKMGRVPWSVLQPKTKRQYIRLATFTMQNRLHPFLYLRVMSEFQVNLFPNVLYGNIALEKYHAYIKRLKQRYRTIKVYSSNISDPSINILRNDLYLIASICDPVVSPTKFFSDVEMDRGKVRFRMYGYDEVGDEVGR